MKNKKFIGFIAGFLSVLVLSSVGIISISLIDSNLPNHNNKNPLNRGDNYELYDLSSYFNKITTWSNTLNNEFIDGNYRISFNEKKFVSKIEDIIRNAFSKIDKFAKNKDKYQIKINYQLFDNNKKLLLDIVWNMPNVNYYFFSQSKIDIL